MGLDKRLEKAFTEIVKLPQLGLGYVLKALGWGKKARMSPFEKERRQYEESVRREFLKLKEKGLSIPVFTL